MSLYLAEYYDKALREIDALRAELAALKATPPSVPDGWVLVPVEPTPAACKAAVDAWLDCDSKLLLNKAAAALRAGIAALKK